MTTTVDYPRAIKAAATRHGITPAQYLAYRESGMKWCRACQEWQPLTNFKSSTSTRDGFRPLCTRHYSTRKPAPVRHGLTRYQYHGCRCTTCRAANVEATRAFKARAMNDPAAADRAGHGRASTYGNYGCRCQPCTKAHTERTKPYVRAYYARRRDQKNAGSAQ